MKLSKELYDRIVGLSACSWIGEMTAAEEIFNEISVLSLLAKYGQLDKREMKAVQEKACYLQGKHDELTGNKWYSSDFDDSFNSIAKNG